ncbi:MAG: peptide-methionine (S)-S-oxide reductase MsrA [Gammaproteobacteria bacterium]|jgi:peptide-methionine (S)-S-oxide reductase|nr:peptide-methionine (S)-S-oxide reductase MsrA [Gammaproteobacteria bacterium]MBT4492604.1 peptide-methionine (S)-S-oxide reductase MsrA [Gammaproteobacteria bacterium]MBT7371351.1 peptide-methionine (S)-S-oxide reductase MsrA [Gammaproteobacteria bacterium]
MGRFSHMLNLPTAETALPGRSKPEPIPVKHFVNGNSLVDPFPEHMKIAMFGLGCFWGAEQCYWQQPGVYITAVGYAGGFTPNPTYDEVCSGRTGHNEVVIVVFDPNEISYQQLLEIFWENHDPTQGMRQGNDIGTQYRSGIYTFTDEQQEQALESLSVFQAKLADAGGFSRIMTEIILAPQFYFADHIHQQYLAKVPGGYCGTAGTGVCYRD